MVVDQAKIARLEKELEVGVDTFAPGDIDSSELSRCDVEKTTEEFGLGCGCGCGGSCWNEQELEDCTEEESDCDAGEAEYELTGGQIDGLIMWLKDFFQQRNGEIKALFDEDELATVLWILDDQWRHERMTEEQKAFWEGCG